MLVTPSWKTRFGGRAAAMDVVSTARLGGGAVTMYIGSMVRLGDGAVTMYIGPRARLGGGAVLARANATRECEQCNERDEESVEGKQTPHAVCKRTENYSGFHVPLYQPYTLGSPTTYCSWKTAHEDGLKLSRG